MRTTRLDAWPIRAPIAEHREMRRRRRTEGRPPAGYHRAGNHLGELDPAVTIRDAHRRDLVADDTVADNRVYRGALRCASASRSKSRSRNCSAASRSWMTIPTWSSLSTSMPTPEL